MSDDFRPTASWEILRLRAGLLRRLRQFFDDRGFLEVETPILSHDTVVDRHLDPFCVPLGGPADHGPRVGWLQTSPELAMKRLMAAGGQAIYQVSRVFRQGEQGTLHNPEFTLVEWYHAGDGLDAGMQRTGELCEFLLGCPAAQRISYRAAFVEHVGLDPHAAPIEALKTAARQCGSPPEGLADADRDGWLDWLITERVQPHLGIDRPALLFDYPASQAALATVRPDNPPVAERFELYISGIELANGYHELLDAEELRRRSAAANVLRRGDGKPPLPEENRLLAAMAAGLPACVGVALGFDRLVMLAAAATSLRDVIAFPFDRA